MKKKQIKHTIKLTDKERETISRFLMIKSKLIFPKQNSDNFCKIINMLDNTLGKTSFETTEFDAMVDEVRAVMPLIKNIEKECWKAIEREGNSIVAEQFGCEIESIEFLMSDTDGK